MKPSVFRVAACCFLAIWATSTLAFAEAPPQSAKAADLPASVTPSDYLVLPDVGQYGRLPLQHDAVEAQIVVGTWKDPSAGETVKTPDGKLSMWSAVKAGDDGTLVTEKLRGGYALTTFDSTAERVMMLDATGDAMVYVNGEPHAGDPYNLGWLRLPVMIHKGKNTLLFHLGADKLKVRLAAPEKAVFFSDKDGTLPTLVRGDNKPSWVWAAVPIINATRNWIDDARIECRVDDGEPRPTPVAPLAPLSVRKVAFQIPTDGKTSNSDAHVHVRLVSTENSNANSNVKTNDKALAEADLTLKRVGPHDIQVRTFHSRIDGSVQSYAVLPAAEVAPSVQTSSTAGATPSSNTNPNTGLIITLHDAGISCQQHIAQCKPKTWAHVLAPQGRRSFGFDWEAWSEEDVFEALTDAR
ncbi:MAG TPA: hypothetical protein VFW73_07880, partial [Lacipirellulaceae bacterium]|nr:hypothetical protein [Lacipirellulaceae bacterium]